MEQTNSDITLELTTFQAALINQVINAVEFAMGHLSKARHYQPTFFEGIDYKEFHRRIRQQWLPEGEKYREEDDDQLVAIRLSIEDWALRLFVLKEACYGCIINELDLQMMSGYTRTETRLILEDLHELVFEPVYRLNAAERTRYNREKKDRS